MHAFGRGKNDAYEQVVFCEDRATRLRAIIAIHSTRLGPALGGTRFYPFADEDAALEDVLRLAEGMTYKSAAAGLDLGGGKAVILGDPSRDKTEALLRAYGRYVGTLGGRYITAEDVGTSQADMDVIRRETRHVTGVSVSLGGSGDPSEATAFGVLQAMQATARHVWGEPSLAGRHIVVSGVGKVGFALCRHLVEQRARLTVADIRQDALEAAAASFGAQTVSHTDIHKVEGDIYSPCALGKALSAETIAELGCAVVVGSANNQLADDTCMERLEQRGILYAPDYIVNAGGVINIAEELRGYNRERAYGNIRRIFDTTTAVLTTAKEEGISTVAAADRVAERRIESMAPVRLIRTFGGSS